MMIEWTNTTATLGQLKPWALNPRLSTKAQAKRLLKSWHDLGQFQTIAVSPEWDVYDGHQRLSALLTVHGPEHCVDVRQSDRKLTDEEHRELVVMAHIGAVGSWDWDKLSAWDAPQLREWGMDADALKALNLDALNLKEMLESDKPAPIEDVEPQIDRAEELRVKWGVEPGQLWQLGDHRLICGDCTDRAVVERVMGGERAEMCFTSPPYNAGVSAKLRGNTSIGDNLYKDKYDDNKSSVDYLMLLTAFTENALSFCEYVFVNIQPLAGNKRALVEYWHLFVSKFADVAIWDKTHAAPAQAQRVMDSRFEFVIVFSGNASRAIGTRDFRGMVHNVYSGNPQRNNEYASVHAATFPIELPEHFISTFSNFGERILDPFSGSGTTLIACERLGRKCRAIEIDPGYVAVALERWATATGKTPELLNG